MTHPLRFGLWYAFRNPAQWRRPYPELYAAVLDQIEYAEGIGYDDVWLTEHHFCEDGHAPSILPLAAAVAVRTKRVQIGTGVLLLPLHDAVRVAEDGATVDILSNGRFALGVGVGYRPQEFEGLGISRGDRATRTDEGLEVIRRFWEGESVDFDGRHYQLRGVKLSPPPVQRPRPPLWVGGFAPAAQKRAARLGDGYIGIGEMSDQVRLYREELGAEGPGRVAGGHFWLIVARDPEATFRAVGPHVLYQIQHYARWAEEAKMELFPYVETPEEVRELGLLQIATPQEAVDLIGEYAEATGIERYYTWTIPPGYGAERMKEHLQLFAEEVMPKFR